MFIQKDAGEIQLRGKTLKARPRRKPVNMLGVPSRAAWNVFSS